MKNLKFIVLAAFVVSLFACGEEALRDPETFIREEGEPLLNAWIRENVTNPYNIDVVYAWKNAGSDQGVALVPPKTQNIQPFLQIILKAWAQPYAETSAEGKAFLKSVTLRELRLFGKDHSAAAATADNGYRITMYQVDNFVPNQGKYSKTLLLSYLHTLHHEFGHILNQMRKYDRAFQIISGSDYKADFNAYQLSQALSWGFVTTYAMSMPGEDFVEVLSIYLTSTQKEWDKLLSDADNASNTYNIPEKDNGKKRIQSKIQIVDDYMRGFGIDITVLRDKVLKAIDEIAEGNIEIIENKEENS
jgi:substrate import-associated zinc metallohydrolase lipoprotein